MSPDKQALLNRIADKYFVGDGGCWEWTASRDAGGYGRVKAYGSMRVAHRVLYELLIGQVPEGLQLDHLCRNRGCVNPEHLEPVTRKENVNRGIVAQVNGDRNRALTHCKRGHEFTLENTYIASTRLGNPARVCRACHALHGRETRRKAVVSCP